MKMETYRGYQIRFAKYKNPRTGKTDTVANVTKGGKWIATTISDTKESVLRRAKEDLDMMGGN